MPALTAPASTSKILVTGANGYIGLWTVKVLLERGFSVRAVVRSEAKAQVLKDVFAPYLEKGKLEFVYVKELTGEGAFDEAVKGVEGVLHLASPLPSASPDPQETIRPAVEGTIGVLKSALKNGSSIQRIVVTSSIASQITEGTEPRVYTEADWNQAVDADVKSGNPFSVYRASKTLAERAVWDFVKTHKASISWDVATVNPSYVYGPTLDPTVASPAALGGTQGLWWGAVVSAGDKDKEALGPKGGSGWVDVRDVAEAHVRALEKEEAGGERVTANADSYIYQEWIDLTNRLAPASVKASLPKGFPELTSAGKVDYHVGFENGKSQRVLGLKYRTKEETVRDIVEDAVKRGWWKGDGESHL